MDGNEDVDRSQTELTIHLHAAGQDLQEIYRTMSSEVFSSLRKTSNVEGSINSFSGSSAIDWMVDNLFLKSRELAIPIGNQMIKQGYIIQLNIDSNEPLLVEHATFEDSPNSRYVFNSNEDSENEHSSENEYYLKNRKRSRVGGGMSVSNHSEVFNALRDPANGLPLQQNKIRKMLIQYEIYENSFKGSEAVNWMLINLPFRTRKEAIDYGTTFLKKGYFIPAVPSSSKSKPVMNDVEFKDNDTLYQLSERNDFPEMDNEEGKARYSLDDFEILSALGKGAVGKVYKVKKIDTGTIYAMKIVDKTLFMMSKTSEPVLKLRNLITERNVLLNDHPFLATLHFSFQTKSKIYLVMDYIQGGNLKQKKQTLRNGIFDKKQLKFIAAEIIEALLFLHRCGIVYRDLKLDNVLIDSEGHITLTDFGICKELDKVERTNSFCGTPSYLAPEVIKRQSYGYEVDFWSLGVMIYEMATGLNPFYNENRKQCFHNVLYRKLVYPETLLQKELISLLHGLLNREPKKRLSSDDIKKHAFFKDINWEKLALRQIKSPVTPLSEEIQNGCLDELTFDAERDGTGQYLHVNDFTFADITHEEEQEQI